MNNHDECIKAIHKFHEDVIKGYLKKPNSKLDESIRDLTDEEFFLLSMIVLFDVEEEVKMPKKTKCQLCESYKDGYCEELELSPCYPEKGCDDFAPRPKMGHWKLDALKIRAFGTKNETYDYSVYCDNCGYTWDYTTDKKGSLVSNFCPNCGLKMESMEE